MGWEFRVLLKMSLEDKQKHKLIAYEPLFIVKISFLAVSNM
jgi:hypothetical protein